MKNNSFSAVLGRSFVHMVACAVGVYLFWLLFKWLFPISDELAIGMALAAILGPGAYDYLGRDLMGNRIEHGFEAEDEPVEVSYGDTVYSRPVDDKLNRSDFIYISDNLTAGGDPLRSMVRDLDLKAWRSTNPDSELALVVFEAIEEKIDGLFKWAETGELPVIALHYYFLHEALSEEIGRDFNPKVVMPLDASATKH